MSKTLISKFFFICEAITTESVVKQSADFMNEMKRKSINDKINRKCETQTV